MKKEESKVIAQKLQKIPNGTLSIERTQAGKNMGETCFSELVLCQEKVQIKCNQFSLFL